MKKAMTAYDRGTSITRIRTKNLYTTGDGEGKFPLFETKVTRSDRVWEPNNFTMQQLQHKTPLLLDRTHTPRGAKRAITLERTFDKDVWVYNKNSLDDLQTSTVRDIKKGKAYKKRILRRKR